MSVPRPTAEDILRQIGWGRHDTAFLSLNLKPAEWDVLQRALFVAPLAPDSRIESQLTEILRQWIATQETDRVTRTATTASQLAATA